jgi:WD40 repeat protein
VGARAGVVQLWDLGGSPRFVRSLGGLEPQPGQTAAVQSLAFSPDGQTLAATDKTEGSTSGHMLASPIALLARWDVTTGAMAGAPDELGSGHGINGSDALAFSPDGKMLAASLLTGGVRLFDPANGRVLRTLVDPGSQTISLAFAPKRTLLAAGTVGGTVEMWNPATGKPIAPPLLADSSGIASVSFDPSGERFATTGSREADAKLWFTARLEQEGPRLPTGAGSTATTRFGPHSDHLLVFDSGGGVFTWPTSLTAWETRACSLAGRNLTRVEWKQLVGGRPYTAVCP